MAKIRTRKELLLAIKEYQEAKHLRDMYDNQLKEFKKSMTDYLQERDLEEIRVEDHKVMVTQVSSTRFDNKRFEQDYSELYDQYSYESSYERLTVK